MRDWLTILCVGVLMFGMVGTMWFYQAPLSGVYVCSDRKLNPTDVQQQCERLTKGQWWHR